MDCVKLLCITDPLTHLPTDTTVELYNRLAVDSRFELYHAEAARVGLQESVPVARISSALTLAEFRDLAARATEPARFRDFDLVWSRADKPFPPGYLDALIHHEEESRFVARPSAMRACDHRAWARAHAGRFMPPGLVTRDPTVATPFLEAYDTVVAKRNRSYGGKGVARIGRQPNGWWIQHGTARPAYHDAPAPLLRGLFEADPEPYEFVRYLPNVTAGDKRVLVVEGDIYGAMLRMGAEGSWINNLTAGGRAFAATVTPGEADIVAATCGAYHEHGIYTLGYDFLLGDDGAWILSEINAGPNVAGYGEVERTSGVPVYARLLDWIAAFAAR